MSDVPTVLSPDAVPGPGYTPPVQPVLVPPGAPGHTDLTVQPPEE